MSTPKTEFVKARVLIVDDERSMAEMIADDLVGRGYDAIAEKSARRAAHLLEDASIDVLITDLRMPEMDGTTLKALIEERLPRLRGRVIYCTGDTANPATQALLRSTPLPVIEKPFLAEDIEGAVRRLVAATEGPRA